MTDQPDGPNGNADNEAQPLTTAQGKTLTVRVDDENMTRSYANAYRTHTTPEEVIVDLGLNLIVPNKDAGAEKEKNQGHILFHVENRVVMNYFTAKRLAITLGQIVRMHEERFGELKLDATERVRNAAGGK